MAKRDWKPQNTKVFILGLGLEDWDNPNDPIGHRDAVLYKFFGKAGVAEDNLVHLRNEGGDRDSILEFLPAFLANSDEETLFIFYYAGHGEGVEDSEYDYDLYFCHPDEELDSFTLADLIETIEGNFNGYNVLMLADCCESGNVARYAETAETEHCYAGLTSALAEESSTGAWTFTDCLLEGLAGKAHLDRDDDGTISLQELANYIENQMSEVENQQSDFGYGANFDPDMRLAIVRN